MRRSYFLAVFLSLLFLFGFPPNTFSLDSFVEFESGQVRPLALSPDGTRLFAVNTPDNRLEIFNVTGSGLTHTATIPVGMEPVAVAARNNNEVWVVNHLSDSISIVDVSVVPARVTRTLLVGDEPSDIVFAGTGGNRAFITTARRGQNHPSFTTSTAMITDLITAGKERADVFVFDATNLGSSLGGTPLTIIPLFGDTPRPLAVSPNGNTVYAGIFHSGNQTTAITEGLVCDNGQNNTCTVEGTAIPGGLPEPNNTPNDVVGGKSAPETGLIVKFDNASGQWRDQLNRNWNAVVRFNLPDKDVFAINANANPPVQTSFYTHVGTILFNMIVNPVTGNVYVTNTEARNEVRFEGPGILGGSTVRGRLAESRVTVLSGATVTPRHLNKHINYSAVPQPAGTKEDSLATPMGMAISSNGQTLYVAALGSSKIGIFNTTVLENNTFTPDSNDHIVLNGVRGPTGLVLDEAHNRLYVLARFDNTVAVVDLATKTETQTIQLFNPEPPEVTDGRLFLYDAVFTSSNGEASCSSCHIFGNMDDLAWDLGNPDGGLVPVPFPVGDIKFGFAAGSVDVTDFHPMKGPMTTQTLRGMVNHGAMHWRGDRTGGSGDPFNSNAAFLKFNPAFEGLVGRDEGPIPNISMQAFADFILKVMLPPNPIRNLDNSMTSSQASGSNFYLTRFSDGIANGTPGVSKFECNGCHVLNPAMNFFGTDGDMSFEAEPQIVKIPHLRNMYQKIGMFGMAASPFILNGDNAHKGDQIRGFGFLHDGSIDTLFRFVRADVFQAQGVSFGFQNDTERRDVEAFMLAFPSDLAPIVGQQITLTNSNGLTVGPRIDLFNARAAASPSECDVIAKGFVNGEKRGWVRNNANGLFKSDKAAEAEISDAALRALVDTSGEVLTYTAVPPGSGTRMGIDRDEDTILDWDDNSQPLISSFLPPNPNQTVLVPNQILFSVSASDPDLDPLSYTWKIDNVPVGGNNTPSFAYAPTTANEGVHTILVEVNDGRTAAVPTSWTVTVQVNHPPQITSISGFALPVTSPIQAAVGQRFYWSIYVSDPDPGTEDVHQLIVTFNNGLTTVPVPTCGSPSSTFELCFYRTKTIGCDCNDNTSRTYYAFYLAIKPEHAGKTLQVTFTPVEALPNVNPGTPRTITLNVSP